MRTFEEIRNIIDANKEKIEGDYKVKRIGVFGSYAAGKQKEESDIDMLVEFRQAIDFFEFIDLQEYLETILGAHVDMVTKNALKPYIGRQILNEVVYL